MNRSISVIIRYFTNHRKVTTISLVFILMCSILILDFPVKLVDTSSADPPTVLDMNPSSNVAYIGYSIYIYVNATDLEDSEDELTPIIEYCYNETGLGGWSNSYIFSESYYGTPDTGWLRVKFEPEWDALQGHYDFRARVTDTEGNSSGRVYLLGKVEVYSPPLTELDITLGTTEVYRGDTLYIFLNVTNVIYHGWELTPEILYLPQNGSWTDIPFSNMSYQDTNDNLNDDIGYWVIAFTPATDENTKLGTYQFRGRVKNPDQGFSNGGIWTIVEETAEVKNNIPTASNLRVEGANTVERGRSIYIFADGYDLETDADEQIPRFEYKAEGEDWEDDYIINERAPTGDENTWRITFSPSADNEFPIGPYDFRVWFEDEDGNESNIIEVEDLVEVKNVVPTVYSLNVTSRQGYRLEPLIITANGSDSDHFEIVLTPSFQYRGPIGDWIGYGDSGSYFVDTTQNMNGHWQIMFYPPAYADLGQYSFRVQFSDGLDTSHWMSKENVYTLMNNDPEVEIIIPEPGEQPSPTVTFTAMAFDMEDNVLTYEWDFGNGETSTEESPTHSYTRSRTYMVTVTVIDSDGDIATDSIILTVLNVDDPIRSSESLRFYFLIMLIVVLILTAIISFLTFSSLKKNGKNQGNEE